MRLLIATKTRTAPTVFGTSRDTEGREQVALQVSPQTWYIIKIIETDAAFEISDAD